MGNHQDYQNNLNKKGLSTGIHLRKQISDKQHFPALIVQADRAGRVKTGFITGEFLCHPHIESKQGGQQAHQ